MDIWDFRLDEEDWRKSPSWIWGHSEIVNHDDPGFAKMLHSMKIHE